MGFLKKLFGQKPDLASPPGKTLAQRFDEEWAATVLRYGVVTGIGRNINVVLKHPQTQEIMAPHVGLNQTFEEWKEISTLADRRRLIFSAIVDMSGGKMAIWYAANFMVANGRADDALETLEELVPSLEEAEYYIPYSAAMANALVALIRQEEAIDWARKAVTGAPEALYYQTLLADALHLSNHHDEAHPIYQRLMAMAPPPKAGPADSIREMFANLFARETGVVCSPVMAFQIGQSLGDPRQAAEFWGLAETEFYDSPHFRMMHAYYLAEQGDRERFFAKLAALVMDMPWVKEANINLLEFMKQVDPDGQNVLPELRAEIEERIQENAWTADGMHRMEL